MSEPLLEIHDTNIYEDISLVLLEGLNQDFNLDLIKNNSLLFLKECSNSLIKKINIRGFQYCLVSNKNALKEIPLNFIIKNHDNNDDNNDHKKIQTYVIHDKCLKCVLCQKITDKLEICSGALCINLLPVETPTGSTTVLNDTATLDINLIYTLTEPTYNKIDKFQESIYRDAIRLDFANKRENYKKHMKQVSSIKSNTSTGSGSIINISTSRQNIKICKAITKKGVKCTNKCIKNSDYCGITSHKSN